MKSDKNVRAPNILRVTKRFNEVRFHVFTNFPLFWSCCVVAWRLVDDGTGRCWMRSFHQEKLPGLLYFGLCSVMQVFFFVLTCFCYFPFQTSSLVASEILRRQSPSARATVIEKWAAVGEVCRNLHNFNTVLEISSAFMSSSIFRLKKTWEKVSKQVSLQLLHP